MIRQARRSRAACAAAIAWCWNEGRFCRHVAAHDLADRYCSGGSVRSTVVHDSRNTGGRWAAEPAIARAAAARWPCVAHSSLDTRPVHAAGYRGWSAGSVAIEKPHRPVPQDCHRVTGRLLQAGSRCTTTPCDNHPRTARLLTDSTSAAADTSRASTATEAVDDCRETDCMRNDRASSTV